MSTANGTPSPVQELQEARARLELARAQHDLAKLQRRTKALQESNLLWDWVSGYQDLLDRLSTTDGKLLLAPSTVTDRRYGAYWPHWRTWQERQLLQAQSRLLVETSDLAFGALAGLTSYAVGDGYTYRVSPRKGQDPPVELVEAVQWVVDEYCDRNDLPSYEQEIFKRTRRDGECFLRDFVDDEGLTELRTVEPEQIMPHPTLPLEEGSFGIINRPGDVQGVLGYWVCYDGIPSDGEEVPTSEMVHIKVNVDRAIKRGMPDFVYDTYEGVKVAGRCVLNMTEGAAIQAAIAEIRQHETATASQVSDFVDDQADFTVPNPGTGRSIPQQRVTPGTVRDIPKGMSYVPPPFSAGSQNWVAIVQAALRKVGVRWNAPEWLISGDASNNNYASSLTAESPFQRRCKRWQGFFKKRFKGNVERAIRNAALADRIRAKGRTWTWDEIKRLLELQCEAPTLVERDTQKAAQENQTYVTLGVKSRQTVAGELGLDWDQEEANNEAYEEKHGQQGGGLPMPGEEGDDGELGGDEEGGGDLASLLGESIVEDREGRFWLTEAREGLIKKVITNKAGRKQTVWVRLEGASSKKKVVPKEKPAKMTVDQAHEKIKGLLGAGGDFGAATKALAAELLQLTVKDLDELKKRLGVKASGAKAAYAQKIAELALGAGAKKPPEKPRPKEPEREPPEEKPSEKKAGIQQEVLTAIGSGETKLADLYQTLSQGKDLSVGQMHDTLRHLADAGVIRFKPFAGAGHQLAGSRTAIVTDRGVVAGIERGPNWGKSPPPEPTRPAVDRGEWQARAHASIVKWKESHPLNTMSLPDLYEALGGPEKLSIGEFHDGLREMAQQGAIELRPFTRPIHELENAPLAISANQEVNYYVAPGSKPFQREEGKGPPQKAEPPKAEEKPPEKTEPPPQPKATPEPPEPGFSGTDTLGRKWVNGKLVPGEPEPPPKVKRSPNAIEHKPGRVLKLDDLAGERVSVSPEEAKAFEVLGLVNGFDRQLLSKTPIIDSDLARANPAALDRLAKAGYAKVASWGSSELTPKGKWALAAAAGAGEMPDPTSVAGVTRISALYSILDDAGRQQVLDHFGIKGEAFWPDGEKKPFDSYLLRQELFSSLDRQHNQPIAERLRAATELHDFVADLGRLESPTTRRAALVARREALEAEIPETMYSSLFVLDSTISSATLKAARAKGAKKQKLLADIAKAQKIQERYAALREEFKALNEETTSSHFGAVSERLRARIKDPETIAVGEYTADVPRKSREDMEEALGFLQGVLQKGTKPLPPYRVWIDSENPTRAHYTLAAGHAISLPEDARGSIVAIHEIMHGVEALDPSISEAIQEFRIYRIGDEKPTDIGTVLGGSQMAGEMGYRDNFGLAFDSPGDLTGSYYAGKIYGSGQTEILTMGVQLLYEDPSGFARRDPEFCTFIVGLLDGTLRKKPLPRFGKADPVEPEIIED